MCVTHMFVIGAQCQANPIGFAAVTGDFDFGPIFSLALVMKQQFLCGLRYSYLVVQLKGVQPCTSTDSMVCNQARDLSVLTVCVQHGPK